MRPLAFHHSMQASAQFPSLRSFAAIPVLCGVFATRSSFIRVIREIRGKVGLVAAMLPQVVRVFRGSYLSV